VYGDIGTSPLYAIRECFHGAHAIASTHDNVLGVLSLIFWALVIIISLKYLVFVLRADNHGEGGILSLTALTTPIKPSGKSENAMLILLGIFGAALLYGDGIITPAISVLSAVEGLTVATPVLESYIVPIAVVILVALFLFQSRGTAGVATVFGPLTLVWFLVIATLGAAEVLRHPSVLAAVNPAQRRSSSATAGRATSSWAPSSSWSPAGRRSTPIWDISARARSASTGSRLSCRRCCSITSDRVRCSFASLRPR
jgi:KUP system potassium uptake protein